MIEMTQAEIYAARIENALLREEIARLHERLEDNHVFDGDGSRIEVEPGSIPDGIEARDTTIKIQDENIDRLRARLALSENNPCRKIFDHKWLDPECVENGCQLLKVDDEKAAYLEGVRDGLEQAFRIINAKAGKFPDTIRAIRVAIDDAR